MKKLRFSERLAVNGGLEFNSFRYMAAVTFLSLSGTWAGTLLANTLYNRGIASFNMGGSIGFFTGLAVGSLIAYQSTDFEIIIYPISTARTVSFLTTINLLTA